ncbi:MAG: bifunctional isocitrate dehydrogenase kinase/phosphatase [Gammaproteobacteria bacterium]|nr:MAG: bifunctional isocitrate dehydrogenase kinase/phosphatase [Gammaproteobacteria bacterium]
MGENRDNPVQDCARFIYHGFLRYNHDFGRITRRAGRHFVSSDWLQAQSDLVERMGLWEKSLARTSTSLHEMLGPRVKNRRLWHRIKEYYGSRIESFADAEFARTFFTSVTRRIFGTVGVDPLIEFVLELEPGGAIDSGLNRRIYVNWGSLEQMFERVLEDFSFEIPYADRARCVRIVCEQTKRLSRRHYRGPDTILRVELMAPVFYQSARAFLVGKVEGEEWTAPFAVVIENLGGRVKVEAVLMSEDDMSILFGFTRSYFFVDLDNVGGAVHFLRALMPDKPIDELYTVLGRVRQGKTERYRDLARRLQRSRDVFCHAPGDKGMVMVVFTLPSHHLVFKVIRDRFGYSKTVTRQQVLDSYRLVSRHDRVGRLIDTQAYRNIELPVDRFSPELLDELVNGASCTTRVVGDRLVIDLVYMERKLRPLNLYLTEANRVRAEAAVRDYGQAIKELAMSNIFPGDMLLKNFGVTRHGRVIFYDFDEICLMNQCRFRELPVARSDEQELASETWFYVADNDVFPEQFEHFLGMSAGLKALFVEHHGDLLGAAYWRGVQERLRASEAPPFSPYARASRVPV